MENIIGYSISLIIFELFYVELISSVFKVDKQERKQQRILWAVISFVGLIIVFVKEII